MRICRFFALCHIRCYLHILPSTGSYRHTTYVTCCVLWLSVVIVHTIYVYVIVRNGPRLKTRKKSMDDLGSSNARFITGAKDRIPSSPGSKPVASALRLPVPSRFLPSKSSTMRRLGITRGPTIRRAVLFSLACSKTAWQVKHAKASPGVA